MVKIAEEQGVAATAGASVTYSGLKLGFALVVVLLTFQTALIPARAIDAWTNHDNLQGLVRLHSATGRPLAALVQVVYNATGRNIIDDQVYTGIAAILFLALGLWLLDRRLNELRPSAGMAAVFLFLIAWLVLANPYAAEWFASPGTRPEQCCAQTLAVLAGIVFADPALTPRRVALGFGAVWTGMALYPVPLAMTPAIAITLLALENRPTRLMLRRGALAVVAWGAGGFLMKLYAGWIYPHLLGGTPDPRGAGVNIAANVRGLLDQMGIVWMSGFRLIPDGVFPALLAIGFGALGISRLSRRAKLAIFAGSIVTAILSFAPHVVGGRLWLTPRSVADLWSIPALCLLGALWAPRLRVLVWAGVLCVVSVCWMETDRMLTGNLMTYRQDMAEGRQIWSWVEQAEKADGVRVTKVAFTNDIAPVWCYSGIRCSADWDVRSWAKFTARLPMMRYISGRDLEETPFRGTLEQVFGRNNWDELSPDEVRVSGDTAYIAIY